MKSIKLLCLLLLISNLSFTQSICDLGDPEIIRYQLEGDLPSIVDMDGDGSMDLLKSDYTRVYDEETFGYYKQNAQGEFVEFVKIGAVPRITTANGELINKIGADLDNDGDMDFIGGSRYEKLIYWSENLAPGKFGALQTLNTTNKDNTVLTADLNSDGLLDILIESRRSCEWFENLGGGNFSNSNVLFASPTQTLRLAVSDLDGDGDDDIVAAYSPSDELGWFEQTATGLAPYATLVASTTNNPQKIEVGDFNEDGLNDVVVVGNTGTAVYFQTTGLNFGTGTVIATYSASPGKGLVVSDFDADGDLDVIICPVDLFLVENLGGGSFAGQVDIFISGTGLALTGSGDWDQDGDVDLLINWQRHLNNGDGTFTKLDAEIPRVSKYNQPVDMNGDGLLDITYQSSYGIEWMPNLGDNYFGSVNVIHLPMTGIISFDGYPYLFNDLDDDGDMDLVVAEGDVYENIGGNYFSYITNIHAAGAGLVVHSVGDINMDGIKDILISSMGWVQGLGGLNYSSYNTINVFAGEKNDDTKLFDIDGDGDLDVLGVDTYDSQVFWHRQSGIGSGSFSGRLGITVGGPFGSLMTAPQVVNATDIDNDGDLDVFAASNGKLQWYENIDGLGNFVTKATLGNEIAFDLADFNDDGLTDVISVDFLGLTIVINQGGGNFAPPQYVSLLNCWDICVKKINVVDFDADGDFEIVTSSETTADLMMYENYCNNSGCDSGTPPQSLSSTVGATNVYLEWDFPNARACQINGGIVSPLATLGSASESSTIITLNEDRVSTYLIPEDQFTPGATYRWRSRCACQTSPLEASGYSAWDYFTIPATRQASQAHSTIDIESDFDSDFEMYPIPTASLLTVSFQNSFSGPLNCQIVDLLGRSVLRDEVTFNAGNATLDLTSLPQGSYLLTWPGTTYKAKPISKLD